MLPHFGKYFRIRVCIVLLFAASWVVLARWPAHSSRHTQYKKWSILLDSLRGCWMMPLILVPTVIRSRSDTERRAATWSLVSGIDHQRGWRSAAVHLTKIVRVDIPQCKLNLENSATINSHNVIVGYWFCGPVDRRSSNIYSGSMMSSSSSPWWPLLGLLRIGIHGHLKLIAIRGGHRRITSKVAGSGPPPNIDSLEEQSSICAHRFVSS